LPSFSAVDATHAWVGSNLGWPHRKATLYSTADGGKKWRPTTLSGQTVAAVYFADLKHGWVVVMDGNKSVIYGTKDGGKTWRKEYALPREGPDWSLRAAGGTLFASDGLMMLERPLAIAAR
jgi:photosystem II stability/assembly factor-like uncharacterized protein